MIDIQKLKQFPLAFKAFDEYVEKQYGSVLFLYNGSGVIKNEDVLLFLDEQGVNIDISVKLSTTNERWYLSYIWTEGDGFEYDEHTPDARTRTEATEQAIEKAFELLETKLKTN